MMLTKCVHTWYVHAVVYIPIIFPIHSTQKPSTQSHVNVFIIIIFVKAEKEALQ